MEQKRQEKNYWIFGIYCAALLIQNILALKLVNILGFSLTTGILISPVVFVLQDIESEIFGFEKAREMILLAYVMNFIFTILVSIAIIIPSVSAYSNQESFTNLFSTTPRIAIASFLAYCVGSLTNTKIMVLNKEKHSLFHRAIFSTVIGQLLDNFIFASVAFMGTIPITSIISMTIGGTILETLYEIVFFPITQKLINKFKKEWC